MSGKKRPPITPASAAAQGAAERLVTDQMKSEPAPSTTTASETPPTIGLQAAGPSSVVEPSPASAIDPVAALIRCGQCLFGQDVSHVTPGMRRCRGGPPTAHPTGLRIGDPNHPHARGVWTEVHPTEDYCAAAKPLT